MSPSLLYRGPALDVLHEQYAKSGRIDGQAPVRAARSVEIDAPPPSVWEVLANPAEWPTIDPGISDIHLLGEVGVDTPFRWRNGRSRIRSRFAVVDPVRELTWTGVSSGARAVHRHVLDTAAGRATLLTSEESMAGPLLTLFYNSAKLGRGLDGWLAAIKTAAEKL